MGLQAISSAELIQQIGLLIPTLKDIVCGKVTENNCSWLDVNKIFCRYALSGMICFPVVQLAAIAYGQSSNEFLIDILKNQSNAICCITHEQYDGLPGGRVLSTIIAYCYNHSYYCYLHRILHTLSLNTLCIQKA